MQCLAQIEPDRDQNGLDLSYFPKLRYGEEHLQLSNGHISALLSRNLPPRPQTSRSRSLRPAQPD